MESPPDAGKAEHCRSHDQAEELHPQVRCKAPLTFTRIDLRIRLQGLNDYRLSVSHSSFFAGDEQCVTRATPYLELTKLSLTIPPNPHCRTQNDPAASTSDQAAEQTSTDDIAHIEVRHGLWLF